MICSNNQDFVKLTGGLDKEGLDNVEYGINFHITVLTDMLDIILICNVRCVKCFFNKGRSFYQIWMNSHVEG